MVTELWSSFFLSFFLSSFSCWMIQHAPNTITFYPIISFAQNYNWQILSWTKRKGLLLSRFLKFWGLTNVPIIVGGGVYQSFLFLFLFLQGAILFAVIKLIELTISVTCNMHFIFQEKELCDHLRPALPSWWSPKNIQPNLTIHIGGGQLEPIIT